ncbi:MAG: type II CAAX endopeptidase family protein [Candidatus Izemoplasma sp.]|nr:type II CAAX endopeptidase family protein [Candidatus Izemoplasma sp.]
MTKTKRLVLFFLFTYVFTWFFWGISLLDSKAIIQSPIPGNLFGIIGTFGPSIIGVIFLIKFDERKFLNILKETFILKGDLKWKLLAICLMPLILGLSYIISRYLFKVDYTLEWFKTPHMIPIVYLFILFLGGPLGEEIGWRGYALKELLIKHNPFVSSIILGLIWTCWHIPAFFIEGSAQQGIPFYLYTINTVILTFIITLLYIKTHYRISAALYFHASANFALGIFYIIDEPLGLLFTAIFIIGTFIFLLVKYSDLWFQPHTKNS